MSKWWTREFYDSAFEMIENDDRYPIIIPSYNRPLSNIVKVFVKNDIENIRWPVYIFVRESQRKLYEEVSENKYCNIVSFPDEEICNAGLVRRKMNEYIHNKGFKAAFSLDDDLVGIGYTEMGKTKSGKDSAKIVRDSNIFRVLSMWQISMDYAINKYNVMMSGLMPMFISWKPEYTTPDQSMLWNRGLPSQAVCLNIDGLMNNDLLYEDNNVCGHEDISLTIKCIEKGKTICVFPFMAHSAPTMSIENWDFNSMRERFSIQQERMINRYGYIDWVSFVEKRDLPQVVIKWPKARKYLEEIGTMPNKEYIFNIWEDGNLLKNYN